MEKILFISHELFLDETRKEGGVRVCTLEFIDLLQTRFEARQAKDFATADRIRAELDALDVVVMDGPEGATWRLKE